MSELLTTVMLTHFTKKCHHNAHLAPPCADIVNGTLQRISEHAPSLLREHRLVVLYDSEPEEMHYRRNLEECCSAFGVELQVTNNRSLQKQIFHAFENVIRTPFTFVLEHDWWLNQTLNPDGILERFDRILDMQYLKLWNFHDDGERFKDPPHPMKFYQHDHKVRPHPEFPTFLQDTLWSCNPHFARTSKYTEDWIPRMKTWGARTNAVNGNAGGVECALCHPCWEDFSKLPFEEAHAKWGLYLLKSDRPILDHVAY